MSKVQILYSIEDPFGAENTISDNFWNHSALHDMDWGSDKQIRNLLPRGKAYRKMQDLQIYTYHEGFGDE